MLYSVMKGAIALYGPAEAERTFVQVTDERVNIEARRLDWTVDGTRMVADTNVKSVLKPQPAGSGDAGSVKRPLVDPVPVSPLSMVWRKGFRHPGLDALRTAAAELAGAGGWLDVPEDGWRPEPLTSGPGGG